ncbi:hypothetical protein J7T55_007120 [Diaporthe amygdali]|uniref:uncharacterized protein n=1 Tax=Phomopsis amygdali TaxID=1214568 RepID=UPI0022FEB2FF|nr:uncharacterized protein J7T55_007120 [Diaporthe amygdali]KAJ0107908.1 hypothetical protein J7T55_007120 [Diaporthe amygdali]
MLESGLVRRYLWVDAICINQGEDQDATDERSLQVSRMAEIYDQATEIVVWLGKPESHMNNRLACQMLAEFERHYYEVANRAAPIWERITPCLNSRLPDVAKRRAMFIQSLFPFTDRAIFDEPGTTIHNAWLGVAAIFSSRWWTRTWVYQESTVPERRTAFSVGTWTIKPGKSRVKFLSGDQLTSWFRLGMGTMVAEVISATPGLQSSFLYGISKHLRTFQLLREHRSMKFRSELTFVELLQYFRKSECQDPRDKVYAPLCLASDEVRNHIRPNYTDKNPDLQAEQDWQERKDAFEEKLAQWTTTTKHRYFTDEPIEDVFNHCVVLDLIYDWAFVPSARGGKFAVGLYNRRFANLSIDEYKQPYEVVAIHNGLACRGLALTEMKFVMAVPNTAKNGDSLWALAGGQVLYLLRHTDPGRKQYNFIGECYAHGLMDGEVSKRLREGRLKLQEISLV